jgi:hypothetical protein
MKYGLPKTTGFFSLGSTLSLLGAILSFGVLLQPATAQVQRLFPAQALRGELQITTPPEAVLNSQPARLAPGARIRDINNMMALSAALVGMTLKVNYTIEPGGLIKDVWILRAEEVAQKPWPRTLLEMQTWTFDYMGQRWSK